MPLNFTSQKGLDAKIAMNSYGQPQIFFNAAGDPDLSPDK